MGKLQEGIYAKLITKSIMQQVADAGGLAVTNACPNKETFVKLVAHEISDEIKRYLSDKLEKIDDDSVAAIVNELNAGKAKEIAANNSPINPKILQEIKSRADAAPLMRPISEVTDSDLVVPDGKNPQLGLLIKSELPSCDYAEWLVSFIKLKAIKGFLPELRKFCEYPAPDGGPRLRIATTTYMGASDAKAIEEILKLPNTEIRISYDSQETRLHAKAYLFHRKTQFSTAYVGSANLSDQAMTTGLEWTVKFSEFQMPHLWDSAKYSFQQAWFDEKKFTKCGIEDLPKIKAALKRAKNQATGNATEEAIQAYTLEPHPYQKVVLDALAAERKINRNRHLIIAATGTGKTMVAAFDYLSRCRENERKGLPRPTLLYIVHRKDILLQAREKFRAVLRDADFGKMLPDEEIDSRSGRYLFTTVPSWNRQIRNQYPRDAFERVFIDECHHAGADSYDDLLTYYKPDIDDGKIDLVGMTATPLREDGKDIRPLFGGSFTHELSLGDAINNGHLIPFSYFGLFDNSGVDFSGIDWQQRGLAEKQVQELLQNNHVRTQNVYNETCEHVAEPLEMRALGFCAGIKHAELMAKTFNDKGIRAAVLTGKSSENERLDTIRSLNSMSPERVKIIFTADLFNEGVDIPNIDTVLFLRPTDSETIYIQQLGRGLRKPEWGYKKDSLLVLDFVSQQNAKFNGSMRFTALSPRKDIAIEKQIEEGMPFLPAGCSVSLSQQAQEVILKNIRDHLAILKGRRFANELRAYIRDYGHEVSTCGLMERFNISSPDKIYFESERTPSELCREALYGADNIKKDRAQFLLKLFETDDFELLNWWKNALSHDAPVANDRDGQEKQFALITALDYAHARVSNIGEYWDRLFREQGLKKDLLEYLEWRLNSILPRKIVHFPQTGFLNLHNRYSRTQIMAALGTDGFVPMTGVQKVDNRKAVAFFVTRHKLERDFAKEVRYQDYAISPTRFKWDSQNFTTPDDEQGRRYIKGEGGYTPMLFVQNHKHSPNKVPESFVFLGPLEYESHEGERPIHFTWRLKYEMPADVFEWAV